jgi:hypothetical protein
VPDNERSKPHTAGPWTARWICNNDWNVDGPEPPSYGNENFIEADARLLAAAPELFAALKAVLGFFDSGEFVRDTSHDYEQGWHLKMIPVVKSLSDANTAIAKAEGKSVPDAQ